MTKRDALNRSACLQACLESQLIKGIIPADGKLVNFGDSIVGNAFGISGNTSSYSALGFISFANLLSDNKLYTPVGGNLGVASNTTTQMVARLGAALALRPKIVIVHGGTNDLAAITAAKTIANLNQIVQGFKAINSIVILVTILPRFAPNAALAANELKRLEINTWIRTQDSASVFVVDAETAMNSTTLYSDGLHPNQQGAFILGSLVSTVIKSVTPDIQMLSQLTADNSFTTNGALTGTAGTKNTATGTVATSWGLFSNDAGGATVVGSKLTVDELEQQVITISGNYTGTTRLVRMYQDHTAAQPANGSTIEGFAEVEILTPLVNIVGIYMQIQCYTAAYASELANLYSLSPIGGETLPLPLEVGRYILRTTPKVLSGVSAIMANVLNIELKTVGSSSPVSGTVKIHKIGVRNVPASVL